MFDEEINYRKWLETLRERVQATGASTRELDTLLEYMDQPQWSASLDERLYEKIVSVTTRIKEDMTERASQAKEDLAVALKELKALTEQYTTGEE